MAGTAKKTTAVGWHTCIRVMLAQTGAPSRAVTWRDTVGIAQTAVTPHTGNGVFTVLTDCRTADVHPITGGSSAVVTGVTASALNIRIIQVDFVEIVRPDNALSHRRVAGAFAETGVALGALPLIVRSI
jgi:hypothetical protein